MTTGVAKALRSEVLAVLQEIAVNGSYDDVCDELGDFFTQVQRCKDTVLKEAYRSVREVESEEEDDVRAAAVAAIAAIS